MKDVLTIFGLCIVAIALGAWLYFEHPEVGGNTAQVAAATTTPSTPEVPDVIVSTVLQDGQHSSGVATRKNYSATDASGLAKLWKMTGEPVSSMPIVDFTKNQVIAVFAGKEPSGGYAINVSKIIDSEGKRTVYVTLTKPASGCVVSQALTSPYQIIETPISELPLAHEDETVTNECGG